MVRPETTTLDRRLPLAGHPSVSTLAWCLIFAMATFVGARIQIPIDPVPLTLQTPIVLLAGALLGPGKGALSQLLYLAAGCVGLPVFAAGGGAQYLLESPTGGYLLSFPLAALVVGYVVHHPRLAGARLAPWAVMLAASVLGLAVVFTIGIARLTMVRGEDLGFAIDRGFRTLQIWNAAKLALAVFVYAQITRYAREPS